MSNITQRSRENKVGFKLIISRLTGFKSSSLIITKDEMKLYCAQTLKHQQRMTMLFVHSQRTDEETE